MSQEDLFCNKPRNKTPWGTEISDDATEPYGGTPPHEDPATSREASHAIAGHVGHLQAVVLETIRASGTDGMTDDEIEIKTGLRHQTASARRRELYLKRRITYLLDFNGQKIRRTTSSGRSAFVFVSPSNQPTIVGPREPTRTTGAKDDGTRTE